MKLITTSIELEALKASETYIEILSGRKILIVSEHIHLDKSMNPDGIEYVNALAYNNVSGSYEVIKVYKNTIRRIQQPVMPML